MSIDQWLQVILIGGLMGMIGQAIRTAVGLKKLHGEASAKQVRVADLINVNVLVISLVIGFACGVVAIIMIDAAAQLAPGKDVLLGLIAAGYGGTDFIEGFAGRYLPTRQKPQGGNAAPAPAAGAG